jgi:type IV pilus assembly protein PilA
MNVQRPGKKGFAVASLVLGVLGLPTAGLLGIGAMLGIVFGVVGLVRARNAPEEYGGKGLAVAGIALSVLSIAVAPVLGIVAAIAIPSLLRARLSANESAVIGELRSVLAAETSYRSINGGHYDTLECLARPSNCVPGHSGPALLDPELAKAGVRNGYHRSFHPGPRPELSSAATPVSPSSVTAFAYVAIPVQPGKTGRRSFCVDARGQVLVQPDGTAPAIVAGACPVDWDTLP